MAEKNEQKPPKKTPDERTKREQEADNRQQEQGRNADDNARAEGL